MWITLLFVLQHRSELSATGSANSHRQHTIATRPGPFPVGPRGSLEQYAIQQRKFVQLRLLLVTPLFKSGEDLKRLASHSSIMVVSSFPTLFHFVRSFLFNFVGSKEENSCLSSFQGLSKIFNPWPFELQHRGFTLVDLKEILLEHEAWKKISHF